MFPRVLKYKLKLSDYASFQLSAALCQQFLIYIYTYIYYRWHELTPSAASGFGSIAVNPNLKRRGRSERLWEHLIINKRWSNKFCSQRDRRKVSGCCSQKEVKPGESLRNKW